MNLLSKLPDLLDNLTNAALNAQRNMSNPNIRGAFVDNMTDAQLGIINEIKTMRPKEKSSAFKTLHNHRSALQSQYEKAGSDKNPDRDGYLIASMTVGNILINFRQKVSIFFGGLFVANQASRSE